LGEDKKKYISLVKRAMVCILEMIIAS
jgi:hypothetical protein